MQDEFTSELKDSLTIIIGYTQLLRKKLFDEKLIQYCDCVILEAWEIFKKTK